jgi:hypothetical protein
MVIDEQTIIKKERHRAADPLKSRSWEGRGVIGDSRREMENEDGGKIVNW